MASRELTMKAAEATKTVAVIVAYNREVLLRKCLDALGEQSSPLTAVIVVDNASTDGTGKVVDTHPVVTDPVHLAQNTGGAGGFAAGIAYAQTHYPQAEWVWIMDDDTVPEPTALAELLKAESAYPGKPALLASKAVWHDGSEHPMNRPRPRVGLAGKLRVHAQQAGAIPVRSASFVSILVRKSEISRIGLPRAAYFLWNDDFEFTARLLKNRVGLYVPASVVKHLTLKLGDSQADPGPRFRFEVRNKLWLFSRHNPFHIWEYPLYFGSSVRRWGKTFKASENRPVLFAAFKAGIKESLTAPKSNREVFADSVALPWIEAADD
ncbi:glycosyltransferase [Boudabousia liubingyangii]|uniref:glycosyltransferase n=1 Tax=Boudabousia liubingyangii TaxID=1921764 RepID=UPI001178593F|nr:glycosyltransferase [Boudabousia liubingyangii]